MLKAALTGYGITMAFYIIPLVHFFTGPIGPLIGGFIAGSMTRARAPQGLAIGGILAILVAATVALIASGILLTFQALQASLPYNYSAGVSQLSPLLIPAIVGGFFLHSFVLGSLGAIVGGFLVRRKQPKSLPERV